MRIIEWERKEHLFYTYNLGRKIEWEPLYYTKWKEWERTLILHFSEKNQMRNIYWVQIVRIRE